jgi:hypothetical protein
LTKYSQFGITAPIANSSLNLDLIFLDIKTSNWHPNFFGNHFCQYDATPWNGDYDQVIDIKGGEYQHFLIFLQAFWPVPSLHVRGL